jgi:hypothetical protein
MTWSSGPALSQGSLFRNETGRLRLPALSRCRPCGVYNVQRERRTALFTRMADRDLTFGSRAGAATGEECTAS